MTEGENRAAETASLAVKLLAKMDEVTADAGVETWHPGLSLE
jgi:uridine phosphorylase